MCVRGFPMVPMVYQYRSRFYQLVPLASVLPSEFNSVWVCVRLGALIVSVWFATLSPLPFQRPFSYRNLDPKTILSLLFSSMRDKLNDAVLRCMHCGAVGASDCALRLSDIVLVAILLKFPVQIIDIGFHHKRN